jgi:HlyD family type I secretion membrane fusion protein
VLDDIRARSEVGALTSRLRVLAATEARLGAERAGSESVEFNHPSLLDRDDPDVRAAIQAEINQFRTRRANALSRGAILRQRMSQLATQIDGFRRQLQGVEQQFSLISEEVEIVDGLYKKGLARMPRLLALQRTLAQLLGSEGELVARIAGAEEAIGETELRIVNLVIERREEVDQQLSRVRGERAELEEQIRVSLDRLRRTEIRAPIAGTVLGLRYKTPGGVIRPGEAILDLVPLEGDLVIEAKVATGDIDNVRPGQNAYIVFPSFAQRSLKRISGTVVRISPDALEDERSGQRYYAARVTVDRQRLHDIAPEIELSPGMPAEVFIETGERTMLEYLMQPFMQSVERAFREN